MDNIQTLNHTAHIVFDLSFENGKLSEIRCWDIASREMRFSSNRRNNLMDTLFIDAVITMCHDQDVGRDAFDKLLEYLYKDEKMTQMAKHVIKRETGRMVRQLDKLVSSKIFN